MQHGADATDARIVQFALLGCRLYAVCMLIASIALVVAFVALVLSVVALTRALQYPSRSQLTRLHAELADTIVTWESLAERITRNAKSAGARLGRALAEGGQTWDDDQIDLGPVLDDDDKPSLDDFNRAKGFQR